MVFEELKVRFSGEDGLTGMLGQITGGMAGATKGGLAMGAMFAVVQMAMQAAMKAIHGLIKWIQDSTKAYIAFEKGLAEVSTLLSDTSPMEGYASGLRELAMASGESLTTLTKGLYQVISASVDAGAAMDVLTVANRAAIAGVSDTATAVDVITSIMNAYSMSAAEAERISDYLFTAVKYGKCVTGDTKVLLSDGRYVRIDSLKANNYYNVVSWDYRNFTPSKAKFVEMGNKQIVFLKTRLGREINTTPEHPYLTSNGWKKVSELKLNDKIAIPISLPFFGSVKPVDGFDTLLGLLLSEGSISSGSPRLTIGNNFVYQIAKESCDRLGAKLNLVNQKDKTKCEVYDIVYNSRGGNIRNSVIDKLRLLGLWGKNCYTKFIPDEIFTWDKESLSHLLNAYFTGDGWFCNVGGKWQVGFSSASKRLVYDISHLLLRFGINGTIRKKGNSWAWSTGRYAEVKRFFDFIGIGRKDIEKFNSYVPIGRDSNTKHLVYNRNGIKRSKKYKHFKGVIFEDSQLSYDKIIEITYKKEEKVYDLTVPVLQNFVANDILAHNTTFGELAAAVGPVITMAANLGVGFDEVSAALATMTRSGIQTTNAVTYLRGMFRSVLKPTSQMKDTAAELGIVFDATTLKAKGLGGFLEYVSEAVGTNTEALARLFPNIRGIQAVMALAGQNAEAFAGDLDHMAEAAGATTAAFIKMEATSAFKLAQLQAEIEDARLEIGEVMVPTLLWWEKVQLGLSKSISKTTVVIGDFISTLQRGGGIIVDFFSGLLGLSESTSEAGDSIKYTAEEITAFAANLSTTIRTIGDYNASIRKATDEIKVLSDANAELLGRIEDLSRIKEITDDFKLLKSSTKDAAYAQQIFDNELRNAQIELLKTKTLLTDLNEVVDEYGDKSKKNNLEIMKIRHKARKEGRDLTKEEEKQIEELELTNEELRIKIEEEAIKIDDIQETALRNQENRVEERKRQLEDEKAAIEAKAQTEIEKLQEEVAANESTITTKLDQIKQWSIDRKAEMDYLHNDLLSKLETFDEEELKDIEIQSGLKLDEIQGFIDTSESQWYNHYQYLKELWDTYPSPDEPGGGDGGAPPPPPEPSYHIAKVEPMVGPILPGTTRPWYFTSTSGTKKTGVKNDYSLGQEVPWMQGGYVSKMTSALLHPGEYVLPKKVVDLLDMLVSRPPSPTQIASRERSSQVYATPDATKTIDSGIHLYGDIHLHEVQNVDAFMEELHRRSRVAGARL